LPLLASWEHDSETGSESLKLINGLGLQPDSTLFSTAATQPALAADGAARPQDRAFLKRGLGPTGFSISNAPPLKRSTLGCTPSLPTQQRVAN